MAITMCSTIIFLWTTTTAYSLSGQILSIFECCLDSNSPDNDLRNSLFFDRIFNYTNDSSCPDLAKSSPFNMLSQVQVKETLLRKAHFRWKNFVSSISPYPSGQFSGRGIVSSSSAEFRGFYRLVASLKLLRWLNCTLPIEIFTYLGELKQTDINSLTAIENVTVRIVKDASVLARRKKFQYFIKPYSILQSRFEHVLWLDSDNVVIKDPEYLFDLPHYKNSTAIFWPDFWKASGRNPIWRIMNIGCRSEDYEQESGQVVINKRLAWKALNLAVHLNADRDVLRFIHGDKDTFRLAWRSVNSSFFFIRKHLAIGGFDLISGDNLRPRREQQFFCGHTMVQHDPLGKVLFLHTNLIKKYPPVKGLQISNQSIQKNNINPWRVYVGYVNKLPDMNAFLFSHNRYICSAFSSERNSTWSPVVEEDFKKLVSVSITDKYLSYMHGNLIRSSRYSKTIIVDRNWQTN